MLRRPALAAFSLVLAVALAGCSDDDTRPSADLPDPVPPASASAATPSYVALGDSYTAAPLITDEVAVDGCLRSSANYPALVAAELGYDLVDVSCSGATSENLRVPQPTSTGEVAPQLDALREDTAVVTIGIGGNDGGVFSRLISCATGRAPCRGDLEAAVDALGPNLTAALAAVRERAPAAEVVVVGYPQIIASDADCPDRLPIAAGAAATLAGLNERIHAVQERAAAAADTTYVDLYDASTDHDVCSDDPWVNGLATTPGVGLALHPLAAGQAAAADLVVAALASAG